MTTFSILMTLGWICLLLGWVIGYIMSNKEQKEIDKAISNFQETVKTGDNNLMGDMIEEYVKALKTAKFIKSVKRAIPTFKIMSILLSVLLPRH